MITDPSLYNYKCNVGFASSMVYVEIDQVLYCGNKGAPD